MFGTGCVVGCVVGVGFADALASILERRASSNTSLFPASHKQKSAFGFPVFNSKVMRHRVQDGGKTSKACSSILLRKRIKAH